MSATRDGAAVLLVEDSATQAMYFAAILRRAGHDVDIAASCEAALTSLGQRAYDIVVSDLLLPLRSGFELCAAIAALPEDGRPPVVLLTGDPDWRHVLGGLEAGASGFVSKQQPSEDLVECVRAVLARETCGPPDQAQRLKVGFMGSDFDLPAGRDRVLRTVVSSFEYLVRREQSQNRELRVLNEQLVTQVGRLAQLNEELGTINYGFAHDMRGPLRTIHGLSEMLAEDFSEQADDGARDLLGRLMGATHRLTTLVSDLEAFSKLYHTAIQPAEIDLAPLAEAIADELRRGSPLRHVEFKIHAALRAKADRGLVSTVLQHLLRNAWTFTASRPVAHIEVGAEPSGDSPVFYVRDDGDGFDPRFADKLFRPFAHLHHDAPRRGSGLGLAAVRQIVTLHGGRVWAEGSPDKGATFYFTVDPHAGAVAASSAPSHGLDG